MHSSVSRFAITAITSVKIDTGGSIFARACTALVFICDSIRLRNQIQFSIYLLLQDEGGNNIHCTNHFYTRLAVVSSVSRFAITAITSLKIDTGGSIFARACTALVFICDSIRLRNQIQFSIYLLLQDEGGNNIHCTNHFYTRLAVVSSVSRFAITAITSLKIDTGGSIFAGISAALVFICDDTTLKYFNL